MMATLNLLVLEGDGIGSEVTREALAVLESLSGEFSCNLEHALFGGAAIDDSGEPVTEATLDLARAADAVLLGAVGGPKWDDLATAKRPEAGLLRMRSGLELFANLRPVKPFAALREASPLRPDLLDGVDFLVVRELVGGIYFGKPRGIEAREGVEVGFNTLIYQTDEIERIGRVAFEAAKRRGGKVTSVDKANVLEVMALWRRTVEALKAREFPEISLDHLYVDNCAMQFILRPAQFDVVVTGNMFGDILSDEAAAVTGSIGMLPSASLGEGGALYEPVHGSAPDIAGQGVANPLATILSVAMLLEHTLERPDLARAVEAAVEAVLEDGLRTGDLMTSGAAAPQGLRLVNTNEMGEAVRRHLHA